MRSALVSVLALGPLLLAAPGCDDAPPTPDAALIDAVAELHLADARAETDSLSLDSTRALRGAALAAHGLDSLALAERIRDLAAQDGALAALYDSVTLRLTLERQGADRAPDTSAASTPAP